MSLEVKDRHNEELFEFLWCIVCGKTVFTQIPFEGVFCKHCNTRVTVEEPPEDRGFPERYLCRFDTATTWNLHREEKLRRDIPGGKGTVAVQGEPGAYEVDYVSSKEQTDWEPVERNGFADQEEPESEAVYA
jgi:DNA-directed RNA polymerase subunit RPC12/RpoP